MQARRHLAIVLCAGICVASLDARAGAVVYTTMSAAVLDFGGGPLDPAGANHLFMASHAPSGAFQWAEHIGGPPQTTTIDSFHAATDCEGNILLAGTFSGEIGVQGATLTAVPGVEFDDGMSFPTVDWFLFKFGPDGALLWAQRFGDAASQRLRGLGVQGDGTIVVAGEFNGTMDLGGPPVTAGPWPDSVLAAFDPAGAFLWQRHFTGSQGVFFWRLHVGPNDRIHVLASASGDTDLGGGPLPYSGSQAILAHFAADGGHQWSQRWQYPSRVPATLTADAAGGTIVSGYAPGFVLRYDAKGLFQWEHLYITDPNSTDRGDVEAVAAGDEIAVIGSLKGAFDFGGGQLSVLTPPTSTFVTRYDLAGNHLTSAVYDATIGQSVYRAAYGPDAELLLGGIFQGSFDLGPGPLVAVGAADLFVHRFSP